LCTLIKKKKNPHGKKKERKRIRKKREKEKKRKPTKVREVKKKKKEKAIPRERMESIPSFSSPTYQNSFPSSK
jgi:hypothetical protein